MQHVNVYNSQQVDLTIADNTVTVNVNQGTPVEITVGGIFVSWGNITGTLSNQIDLQNALNAKVPYTGATGNVTLGEYGLTTGYLQFDITPTTYVPAVGNLGWNDSEGTIDLLLKGGSVSLPLGQKQVARVVNGTGGNVLRSNYQVVKVTGAQGQRLQVNLAQANNDANSADTLGLIAENINNNNAGFIITSGLVENINTTGSLQGETWADGNILYLSPTIPGAITNIKPQAPQHTVIIGFVIYAHQNNGKIFCKIDNGYELDELHNVRINTGTLANGQVLKYNTSLQVWENSTDIVGTGTVTSITASSPLTGGTITTAGTIGITQASGSSDGYLSSTDWTTFNNKQNALTNPVTGTGANGQVAIWNGATTQTGTNNLFWDSSNNRLGIGTNTPALSLDVNGDVLINGITAGRGGGNSSFNTAFGTNSLLSNTTGMGNTSFGLNNLSFTTSGGANSAFGVSALNSNQIGSSNSAFGYYSLFFNTGFNNTAVGNYSLFSNTLGSNNIAIGNNAGNTPTANTTGSNNIFIGTISGVSATESNRTWIGNSSTVTSWIGGNLLLGSTTTTGERLQVTGNVKVTQIDNATTDTDRFLVSDSGVIKYRTGSEILSDIGAQAALTNPITGTGTSGQVAYFNGTNSITSESNFTYSNGGITLGSAAKVSFNNTANTSGFDIGLLGGPSDPNAFIFQRANFALIFGTNNTERVRLHSSGNLSVGNQVDSGYKLDVTGNGRIYGNYLIVDQSSGSDTSLLLNQNGVAQWYLTNKATSGRLNIGNGNGDALIIDLSRNFGLGVTPSAWANGIKSLEINYAGNGIWSSTPTQLIANSNAYYASGGWTYASNNPSAYYSQFSGGHYWYNAPSGTAGNPITFTQAMTLDANGRLGIGTTSPSNELTVRGTTSGYDKNIIVWERYADGAVQGVLGFGKGNDNNVYIGSITNHPLILQTNNTERARITSTGNLLVGTTTDAGYKLDVSGSGRFSGVNTNLYNSTIVASGDATYNPKITLASTTGYRWSLRNNDVGGNGEFTIRYEEGSLDALNITRNGNIGLGVTPSAWQSFTGLQVGDVGSFASNDFGSGNIQTFIGNNVYYDNGGFKYIQAATATMFRMLSNGEFRWEQTNTTGTAGNAITFTQAMTLASTGNLLVGTTTDSGYKLDVSGTGRFSGNVMVDKNFNYIFDNLDNSDNGAIVWKNADGSRTISAQITSVSDGTFARKGIGFFTKDVADWTTPATQKMYLNPSGNLGLGVTPSAWQSIWKPIELQYGAVFAGLSGGYTVLRQNAYTNSSGVDTYISNGYANDYYQYAGQHVWRTAPSGTAGNPISFTQAMTLDASGRLGVGLTSLTEKFTVSDNGNGNLKILVQQLDNTGATTAQFKATHGSGTAAKFEVGSGYLAVGSEGNHPFVLSTNNTERARFTGGGNLLVGTTTDSGYKTDINGTLRVQNSSLFEVTDSGVGTKTIVATFGRTGASPTGTSREAGIVFSDNANTTLLGGITGIRVNSAGNFLGGVKFYVNSGSVAYTFADLTEAMTLDSSGRLGIGTTTPNALLNLYASDLPRILFSSNSSGDSWIDTFGQSFRFINNSASGAIQLLGNGDINLKTDGGNVITFATSALERARISSAGNLLVGTTTDSGEKLQVNGTAKITGATTLNGDLTLSYAYPRINLTDTGNDSDYSIINDDGVFSIYDVPNAAHRLRITSGGNIGIGITNPDFIIDAYGASSGIIRVRGGSSTNEGGAFYVSNSAGTQTLAAFGDTARILGGATDASATIFAGAVPLTFYINSSERARITSGGNLLVGTTTDAGQKLQVNGDALINGITAGRGGGSITPSNTAFGNVALRTNTTGNQNTAIGYQALELVTDGRENVAVGSSSGSQHNGSFNTSVGCSSLGSVFGNANTAVGYLAMFGGNLSSSADANTAIGRSALASSSLTGDYNIAVGAFAGRDNTSGIENIYIGTQPQTFPIVYNTTGSNNIFIGHDVRPASITESNRVYIGNSSTATAWIGGNLLLGSTTTTGERLQVTGTSKFTDQVKIIGGNTDVLNFKFSSSYGNTNIGVLFDSGSDAGNSLSLKVNNASGTATERLVLIGNGQLKLNSYTSTTSFTGTAAGVLAFDSSGNILTIATPGGGSGITSLNGLNAATQTFATGTSGTDFNISSVTSTHTFNIPTASATNRGALSSTDWSTFNSKLGPYSISTKTSNYTETATSGEVILLGDTTGGTFTITLPTAVSNTAKITIKKIAGSANLTIDGNGSQTIDGGLTADLVRVYESITLVSDNSNWHII